MDYPPPAGTPAPTPTPRPVSPGYVSPADYLETCCTDIKDNCSMGDTVTVETVYNEMRRILAVLRDAET